MANLSQRVDSSSRITCSESASDWSSTTMCALSALFSDESTRREDREGVISFGQAALLYLVTEELLVEAHEVKETLPATAMFFIGILALIVLDVVT